MVIARPSRPAPRRRNTELELARRRAKPDLLRFANALREVLGLSPLERPFAASKGGR